MMYNLFKNLYSSQTCIKFMRDWEHFIKYESVWIM